MPKNAVSGIIVHVTTVLCMQSHVSVVYMLAWSRTMLLRLHVHVH